MKYARMNPNGVPARREKDGGTQPLNILLHFEIEEKKAGAPLVLCDECYWALGPLWLKNGLRALRDAETTERCNHQKLISHDDGTCCYDVLKANMIPVRRKD